MVFRHKLSLLVALSVTLVSIGCGGTPSTDPESKVEAKEGAGKDPAKEKDGPLDARALIMGRWKINPEVTKEGWGDKRERFERVYVDELTMELEFRKDDALEVTKNGKSFVGYWTEKSVSEGKIIVEVGQKKDAERKLDWTFTFNGPDRVRFQSSEVKNEDNLILDRKK